MFLEPVLTRCVEWTNESIMLDKIPRTKLHLDEMYRFFTVFVLSHFTGFSIIEAIAILRMLGHGTTNSCDIRFIASNNLGFIPI